MFTILCRHAHSDWQSTEAMFICYRKVKYYVTMDKYYCPL